MFSNLPNEIVEMILLFLDNRDERLMRVNKLFYEYLNRRKSKRFQLIKNKIFNYLMSFQSTAFKYLINECDGSFFELNYSETKQYEFRSIYYKCMFYSDFIINYIIKDMFIVTKPIESHLMFYFDIYCFNSIGDLCFKPYHGHLSRCVLDDVRQCTYCFKEYEHELFPVERIFDKDTNTYTDFSININDNDCIDKLNLLFSHIFSNFGSSQFIIYNTFSHNRKCDKYMNGNKLNSNYVNDFMKHC